MPTQMASGSTAAAALRALSRLLPGEALESWGFVLQYLSTTRCLKLFPQGRKRLALAEASLSPINLSAIAAAVPIGSEEVSSIASVNCQTRFLRAFLPSPLN